MTRLTLSFVGSSCFRILLYWRDYSIELRGRRMVQPLRCDSSSSCSSIIPAYIPISEFLRLPTMSSPSFIPTSWRDFRHSCRYNRYVVRIKCITICISRVAKQNSGLPRSTMVPSDATNGNRHKFRQSHPMRYVHLGPIMTPPHDIFRINLASVHTGCPTLRADCPGRPRAEDRTGTL
jgi:hypothetical protein